MAFLPLLSGMATSSYMGCLAGCLTAYALDMKSSTESKQKKPKKEKVEKTQKLGQSCQFSSSKLQALLEMPDSPRAPSTAGSASKPSSKYCSSAASTAGSDVLDGASLGGFSSDDEDETQIICSVDEKVQQVIKQQAVQIEALTKEVAGFKAKLQNVQATVSEISEMNDTVCCSTPRSLGLIAPIESHWGAVVVDLRNASPMHQRRVSLKSKEEHVAQGLSLVQNLQHLC
jgi:hypothetical protein